LFAWWGGDGRAAMARIHSVYALRRDDVIYQGLVRDFNFVRREHLKHAPSSTLALRSCSRYYPRSQQGTGRAEPNVHCHLSLLHPVVLDYNTTHKVDPCHKSYDHGRVVLEFLHALSLSG